MNNNYNSILEIAGIRPSVQRVAIYTYIKENPIHPDVDTVYSALSPMYATLSKTTVYNTLKLFEEKKIIQTIRIEDDKVRFDANLSDHLHFKCLKCGSIFDIMEPSQISSVMQNFDSFLPSGFKSSKIQTYIWGMCEKCSSAN